jgi:hypothetical protein
LKYLGVEHIPAYSPQARGRSERMFGTLQDRLIKELAKAGIGDIDAANAFIRDVYLPAHNARFSRAKASFLSSAKAKGAPISAMSSAVAPVTITVPIFGAHARTVAEQPTVLRRADKVGQGRKVRHSTSITNTKHG